MGIVVGFRRGRLTLATVVHAYTALVLGVCLVLALAGGALLLKALASAVVSRDFSDQDAEYPQGTPPPGVAQPPLPRAAARAATQAADDLTAGLTLLVLGGGLGAAHACGKAVAARRDTTYAGLVERGYAVAMLVVGTVVTAAAADPYARPHPGGALGFALLFVPLWAHFARRVWHLLAGDPQRRAGPLPR